MCDYQNACEAVTLQTKNDGIMGIFIIADNQQLTASAIEIFLKRDEYNQVFYANDKNRLLQLLKQYERAVVVLDYTLFDFENEDSLLIVSERFEQTTWVLLSAELTDKFLKRVTYASKAFSVVFKDEPLKAVRDALSYAGRGNRYLSQKAAEKILHSQVEQDAVATLTATEIEIVKCIAKGLTTKEIAVERFSSIHTITTHRKNIFRKLGVNNAHEAIKYALRAGWIDASEFYI